jgi:hypothetical protein
VAIIFLVTQALMLAPQETRGSIMKRLFAAVAISALTLSTAAFAADTGAQKPVDQKAQVPAVTTPAPATASPAKPMANDSKAAKPSVTKKEKSSLNVTSPATVQKAQASGGSAVTPSKTMTDGAAAPAKKAATVKKSDGKASSETAQPSTTVKPATK